MKRRTDRVKAEMKRAEENLHAADILHRQGFFNPSASLAHSGALHAVSAAFLTAGIHAEGKFSNFIEALARFDHKLGPFLKKFRDDFDGFHPIIEYDEKESLLRIHQTKELLLEVKDFLRRAMR